MPLKDADVKIKSEDLDQTVPLGAHDLGLHCSFGPLCLKSFDHDCKCITVSHD